MRHYGDSENTEIKTTKSRDVQTILSSRSPQDCTKEITLVARLEDGDICGEWFDLTTITHPELLICKIQII